MQASDQIANLFVRSNDHSDIVVVRNRAAKLFNSPYSFVVKLLIAIIVLDKIDARSLKFFRSICRHLDRNESRQFLPLGRMRFKPIRPTIDCFVDNIIFALVLLDFQKHIIDQINDRLGTSIAGRKLRSRLKVGKLIINEVKNLSHATTPSKDRLLHVADAKERPKIVYLFSDRVGKRTNHIPLPQRRILEFVKQQVLDLMVEPE